MIWWLDLALPFPPLFRPCLYQVYSREEQLVFVYDTENETRNVQWIKNGAVIHKWSQRQADTHEKPIPESEMKTCCEIAMLCNQSELCKDCNYRPKHSEERELKVTFCRKKLLIAPWSHAFVLKKLIILQLVPNPLFLQSLHSYNFHTFSME